MRFVSDRENRQRNARLRALLAQIHSSVRTRTGIVLNQDGIPVHARDGRPVKLPAALAEAIHRFHEQQNSLRRKSAPRRVRRASPPRRTQTEDQHPVRTAAAAAAALAAEFHSVA